MTKGTFDFSLVSHVGCKSKPGTQNIFDVQVCFSYLGSNGRKFEGLEGLVID